MASHGVPEDAALAGVRKLVLDQSEEFFGDVVVHLEVLGPRLLSGIDVESRALSKVVGVIIWDSLAAWARIRCDDQDFEFRRDSLKSGFGDEVLFGAGQAAQEVE